MSEDETGNIKRDEDSFVQTFNLPHSQMHFKPETIKSIDDDVVTLTGREGSTNMKINVKITMDMLHKMEDTHPTFMKFMMDDYKSRGEPKDHLRDETCEPDNRTLLWGRQKMKEIRERQQLQRQQQQQQEVLKK